MGFYIRKSFSLGPLRFNLGNRGVGVSAGVKGARFGVNSSGKSYGHFGRGGLYYRTGQVKIGAGLVVVLVLLACLAALIFG